MNIRISSDPKYIAAYTPEYHSISAAGADLRADIPDQLTLQPLQRQLIPTGIRIALPHSVEAQVRPRSGLAARSGITVINAPGTIDPDYRGEISVPVVNLSSEEVIISPGDRIAQMVIAPFIQASFQLSRTEELTDTDRGSGGFGSTGIQ
ncbi:dUTP diphosphatase [Spirochaeta dissipatitropha]